MSTWYTIHGEISLREDAVKDPRLLAIIKEMNDYLGPDHGATLDAKHCLLEIAVDQQMTVHGPEQVVEWINQLAQYGAAGAVFEWENEGDRGELVVGPSEEAINQAKARFYDAGLWAAYHAAKQHLTAEELRESLQKIMDELDAGQYVPGSDCSP